MKKILFLFNSIIIIFLSACQRDTFTCEIQTLYNGQSILTGKDLTIVVEAMDTRYAVTDVRLFFDQTEVEKEKQESRLSPPIPDVFVFIVSSENLTLGKHTVRAVAANNKDKQVEVSIVINVVETLNNEKESPDFVTFADGKFPEGWRTYSWEITSTTGFDDLYSLKSASTEPSVYTKKTMDAPAYVEFYTYMYAGNPNTKDIDLYIDDVKAEALLSELSKDNWVKWIYAIDPGQHAFRWQTEGASKYLDAVRFAPARLATVSTADVHSITSTYAVSGGTVNNHGNSKVFARGVCWNTAGNPTINDFKTTNNYGLGDFTSYLTGLTPNTTYYIRAYAINGVGTAYGEQKHFKTRTTK
jgi:hypothetical protein